MEEEIKELKEEIKELKEEIKEFKNEIHNKCFVDTDEEHNKNGSEDVFNYILLTKRIDMLYEDVERLKKENNYLMKMQKEREIRLSKFFTYDSTDSE